MQVIFSLEQLKLIRTSIRMSIDLNHINPSFRFNDMMDLYQEVSTYCGRSEDIISVPDKSEVIK